MIASPVGAWYLFEVSVGTGRFAFGTAMISHPPSDFFKPFVMAGFREQVTMLLTAPPQVWDQRAVTFDAYRKALLTALRSGMTDRRRIAALEEGLVRRYYPWRSMAEAMAEDLAAGSFPPQATTLEALLAYYQEVVRRKNPALFHIPVARVYRAAGLPYRSPVDGAS